MRLVLLVVFVVVMLLWALALLGGTVIPAAAGGWLPFIAVADLGVIVFIGGGPVTVT